MGHPLLLATRQLLGLAPGVRFHVHQRQHFLHPFGDVRAGQPFLLEAKGNIFFHRHMREERIRLKHHIDRTPMRRHRQQIHTIQLQATLVRLK